MNNSWEDKKSKLQEWHQWYSWYPVSIGNNKYKWLETVERKGTLTTNDSIFLPEFWQWDYRIIK